MDFLKKNYEKVLLSAVLLGLVGVLVMMWFVIQSDKRQMEEFTNQFLGGKVSPLPELDLSNQNNAIQRLKSPLNLDLETTNKLFNPVEWQRGSDGRLVKRETLGIKAAVVTGITPLYFILTLDSVETNELGARYTIGVERQAAATQAARRKQPRYASVGEKKDFFTLTSIQGAAENPEQLILKLDNGEIVEISKSKAYRRVEGYAADIKYDPERKIFNGRRIGSMISFGGEDYIIVAIDKDEVIVSAQSNLKKYTLRYAP
jgi:hypothetical protein